MSCFLFSHVTSGIVVAQRLLVLRVSTNYVGVFVDVPGRVQLDQPSATDDINGHMEWHHKRVTVLGDHTVVGKVQGNEHGRWFPVVVDANLDRLDAVVGEEEAGVQAN